MFHFLVNLFFIGTDGWSERTGFTNRDQMRAQAVRDMSRQTEKVVVVTKSDKFTRHSTIPMNLKNVNIEVITDQNISSEVLEEPGRRNIETICV